MNQLLAHCAQIFSQHGGIFTIFFLGGLTGGFTHCLAMCGSYVACERMCASKICGTKQTIRSATGLNYHLGRMTTYGFLGFFVALLSKQIVTLPFWSLLSASILAIAGIMFLVSSLPDCKHSIFKSVGKLTYFRGVLLGFMPCGLLYAALMMAATLADPMSGMIAMWIFTLGTVPALLIASFGAGLLSMKWQRSMQNIGRAVMMFNGVSLLVMAARLIK
jgi:sulfite exporter TauE/SafE